MLRSQRWSSRSPRPSLWPLWLLGATVGVAAEWSLYGWSRPGDWVPDLITGWCLLGCGLVSWSVRPQSRSGPLLAATGFTWFAPNFATSGASGLDWLSAHALYLHRAPLVALVLTYPRGRPGGRLEATAIAGFCLVAVITPLWENEVVAVALSAGMIGVAALGRIRAVGAERRMRLRALQATALVGATIAATASVRLAVPGHGAAVATLRVYEAMLCGLSVWLLIGLARAPWERSEVTDLVVELAEMRSGTLRDALARALGDPSLELGFWLAGERVYVDAEGHPLRLPPSGSPRSATRIDRDGEPVAVLVHDRAVLADQGLVDAVESAAKLAAANVRLRADLRGRLVELGESRRRIIAAGDEERDQLEVRLSHGAQRRLSELGRILGEARKNSAGGETTERIARAQVQLVRAQEELCRLARGMHPRELSEHGLASALASLVEDYSVPVELSVPDRCTPPEDAASCAYFVCSEALANVAKYASASRVRISVTVPTGGGVAVEIEDDGIGGADFGAGTGLRGLSDRVDALGGTLIVASPAGGGTRLTAVIPSGGNR